MDNFNFKNFINENNLGAYSKLEGKKRDVDGDGDIDSDDYMAAKDAAIKKAMGKTEAIADPDSLTSIIMGGLAAVGAVKALPKLVDLLGDGSGDITIDSLKRALSKKDTNEASAEEEDQFHTKLDKLVHKTFGASSDEKPEKKSQFKKAGERAGFDMRGIKEDLDEDRFLAASMEDLEQVVRNLAHTGEMSEDEAIELAIGKLEAMLDGRDDLDENVKEEENITIIPLAKWKAHQFWYDKMIKSGALDPSKIRIDRGDDLDENVKEEIGDGTFDEKMTNLIKAASIMNSYVKEFGDEEEQRMFRKIYMDLDDFEVFMSYDDTARRTRTPGTLEEDLDIGHQDDEPNMLKKKMYRTAKMAAMIYKELDKFDSLPNEVDFPNWWQAKLIKANDYLNSAFDYLDGEQQTAKLDAMAEKKVEVDDDTDFKIKLSHLLDKHVDN